MDSPGLSGKISVDKSGSAEIAAALYSSFADVAHFVFFY
jgi:hypothetical protein